MPFDKKQPIEACPVCGGQANIRQRVMSVPIVVDCSRCGDYRFESREVAEDVELPIKQMEKRALVSFLIRQMSGALVPPSRGPIERPMLSYEFFRTLHTRTLPLPSEAADNMLIYLGNQCGSSPGTELTVWYDSPDEICSIGVVKPDDVVWVLDNLKSKGLFKANSNSDGAWGTISLSGWERIHALRQVDATSRYAFFARQFKNIELDRLYKECLVSAVRATGFELQTVTQRAGLVDAVIEDEIRRSAFLLADLSDHNAGAYWEAGFAEGLGKPVIYICKANDGANEIRTHFDANHRHTVRWDLGAMDETAAQLKAVIRNTLPDRAKQSDV